MRRKIGKLLFFIRFLPSFTAPAWRWRQRGWSSLPSQKGKTWLVTGATGGIGRAICVEAHRLGAQVIAVGRNLPALEQLTEDVGQSDRLIPLQTDLSLLQDIDQLPAKLTAHGLHVDVLVNNVGVLLNEQQFTTEGHETSFASNLLGHYQLTEALLEKGHMTPQSCIINMSSGGMYNVPLMVEALDRKEHDSKPYDGVLAYAIHKRAQVELNDYWRTQSPDHTFYVMHPGWVDTVGVQTALPDFRKTLRPLLRTAEMGADTAVWLGCTQPEQHSTGIWFDRKLRPAHIYQMTHSTTEQREALVAMLHDSTKHTLSRTIANA